MEPFVLPPSAKTQADCVYRFPRARGESSALEHEREQEPGASSVKAISTRLRGLVAARKLVLRVTLLELLHCA